MKQTVPSKDIQPRFKAYMFAKGLRPGDNFAGHDYINWISRLSAEYKKTIRKDYLDILSPTEQNEFTEFINARVYAINQAV